MYEHAEIYSEWAMAQRGLGDDQDNSQGKMVYWNHIQETVNGEVNPEEETSTTDTRGNCSNKVHLPQFDYQITHLPHELEAYYPSPLFTLQTTP